jgi:4-amino-4-deoxy-L-arabinose transferase-like glycosyltransferase
MDGARGMVETGDWLVPRYQGEAFFDKPALTYWLMAASFRGFGVSLGAGRLVSALAALACIVATAGLGRRLLGPRPAVYGALALGTTLLVLSFGRVAMSDMLLTLWCTLAVAIAVAMTDETGATLGRMAALGATLGLGFLTKGPVALVLAGLGLALLVLRGHEGRRPRLDARALAVGALAFSIVGLGWFAAVAWRLGLAPLEYFFLRENLERFAGETYDAERSPLFYVWTYFAAGLPWSLLFPLAAVRGARRAGFLLLWMGLMAVPLSLSRGKIDYYLLPLLPAASLVIGSHLAAEWDRTDREWARGALIAFAVIALVPAALQPRIPTDWLPGWPSQVALIALGAAVALAAALAAARPSPSRTAAVFAAGTAATLALLAAAFLPAFRRAQPNAAVVTDVRRERSWRPDAELAACGDPRARRARSPLRDASDRAGPVRRVGARVVAAAVPAPGGARAAPVAGAGARHPRDRGLSLRARGGHDSRPDPGRPGDGTHRPARELPHGRSGSGDQARQGPEARSAAGGRGLGGGPASGGGERVARADGQALSSRKISPAARTVASMSLSVCASETNAASYWAGGK